MWGNRRVGSRSGKWKERGSRRLLEALETVRANKLRYAQAEASARARRLSRPPHFDIPFFAMADAMNVGVAESHVVTIGGHVE